MVSRSRLFSPPRNILCVRFGPQKSAEALVSRTAYQGFQAQPDSFRVGSRSTGRLSLFEQGVVDIERLFHMYYYAIQVWLSQGR
jgi:hypothetical protein